MTPPEMTPAEMTPAEIAEDAAGSIVETKINSTQRKSAHISAAQPKEILLRTQLPSRSDNPVSLTSATIRVKLGIPTLLALPYLACAIVY